MTPVEAKPQQQTPEAAAKEPFFPPTAITTGDLLSATTDPKAKEILKRGAIKPASNKERLKAMRLKTRLELSFESMLKDLLQTPDILPEIVDIQNKLHLKDSQETKRMIYGGKYFIRTQFEKIMAFREYMVKHGIDHLWVKNEFINFKASEFSQTALKIGLNQWVSQSKEGNCESAHRPNGKHTHSRQLEPDH